MKYIIDNKEYDTATAILLCKWKDNNGAWDLLTCSNVYSIYATSNKNLFLVTENAEKSHAEILDTETAQRLFNEHCENIVYDAYTAIYTIEKG